MKSSGLHGFAFVMIVLFNFCHGPWDSHQRQQQMLASTDEYIKHMSKDDPLLRFFWDDLCADYGMQTGTSESEMFEALREALSNGATSRNKGTSQHVSFRQLCRPRAADGPGLDLHDHALALLGFPNRVALAGQVEGGVAGGAVGQVGGPWRERARGGQAQQRCGARFPWRGQEQLAVVCALAAGFEHTSVHPHIVAVGAADQALVRASVSGPTKHIRHARVGQGSGPG